MTVDQLKNQKVFRYFYKISQIPHVSGHTKAIAKYLKDTLNSFNASEVFITKCGNVIGYFKATDGFEKKPMVALQCHMDMVGSKMINSKHNFATDPITWKITNGWLTADGTTLGADNGVGIAIILEFLSNPKNVHGSIQIIFTVDEETTLLGATKLKPKEIQAQYLINLDSETSNSLCLGCARAYDLFFNKSIELVNKPQNWICLKIGISNLHGGHSGNDIHLKLINAIKEVYYWLAECLKLVSFSLVSVDGGVANNVIPNSYEVVIALEKSKVNVISKFVRKQINSLKRLYPVYEKSIDFKVKTTNCVKNMMFSKASSFDVINAINGLFNGLSVYNFDLNIPEVSCNIGKVSLIKNHLELALLARSPYKESLERIASMLVSSLSQYGFKTSLPVPKDGWIPNLENNQLAKQYVNFFKSKHNKDMIVNATAGELEVAEIISKKPIEAISIGMEIINPHSPNERVNIDSVWSCYEDLVDFLGKIN